VHLAVHISGRSSRDVDERNGQSPIKGNAHDDVVASARDDSVVRQEREAAERLISHPDIGRKHAGPQAACDGVSAQPGHLRVTDAVIDEDRLGGRTRQGVRRDRVHVGGRVHAAPQLHQHGHE